MRASGRTTRLFHAVVGMGLGAAAAGCGGQTSSPAVVGTLDAADDAVSSADARGDAVPAIELSDDASADGSVPTQDATLQPDAGLDGSDAGSDHFIPRPPVIA